MNNKNSEEIVLNGISGSPGICIGRAYLVGKEGVDVVGKYYIPKSNLENEVMRFKNAVHNAKEELKNAMDSLSEDLQEHVYILETHMVLHEDKMLYDKTIEMIEASQVNAEWALKSTIRNIGEMFDNISDPYLKSRSADITQVGERIMRNLVGEEEVDFSDIDKRVILVANDLSPADTSRIQLEKIKGFVTNRGGKASHTSIIARSLEIPSVLGLESVTDTVKNDDIMIVDGTIGQIIIRPTKETIAEYKIRRQRYKEYKAYLVRSSNLPAKTLDGYEFHLMANIELAEEVVSVKDNGGDGIGLFRTEFLYMNMRAFPKEEVLFEQYKSIVELMAPRPVTIRTLDINGDKVLSYSKAPDEVNPALGLRAIRFCLKRKNIFKTQLRAILRAAMHGPVKLMFPMISGLGEMIEVTDFLNEVKAELREEGTPFNDKIEVGIMIEVPAAVIIADSLADYVDFFSIGTNDLIQYTLAIDRENRHVAHLYNPLHPAVLKMLKKVSDVGKRKNIQVCMCGEMANEPSNMPILIGLGIDELSMNPQAIPAMKNAIRLLDYKRASEFVDRILKEKTADRIQEMIDEEYGNILSQIIYKENFRRDT
ncbi:MAG: phosphoenolpyruvate--protein phosphotransferase [Desulfobacterales bacterium]|nr:phosphoenolpyruvate--protein phosphotransferase [Desulfobacterales bacterium]MCP4158556.1 phosphoenolpyruvate--protein phosphotransferase [Deltaproteobacteria bacterium]